MKTSMRFDLVDLRLFLFVVEAANITHGATRAGMALASASERIRLMEESLGAPLLERHRRGVRATAAGAALAHHAQPVVQQLERMRGELSEYANGFRARVRLLANTTATAEFLPVPLAAFLTQHPLIDVDLEERSSREIVRAVAGNLAEIGVVGDEVNPAKELQTFPFAKDRLVLIAPHGPPSDPGGRCLRGGPLAFGLVKHQTAPPSGGPPTARAALNCGAPATVDPVS
jgi:DNA-binding transcriptional LysR family regulator